MDLGAHLSILASFSLIFVSPILERKMKGAQIIRRSIAQALAPFLILSPLLIMTFNRFNWVSLIANILVVGLGEWIVSIGFFGMMISLIWPTLAGFILHSCWIFLRTIEWSNGWILRLPHPSIQIPDQGIIWILAISLCISGIIFFRNSYLRFGAILSMIIIILMTLNMAQKQDLKFTVIDVGPGDAILIQYHHQNILVDTGPQKNMKDFYQQKTNQKLVFELSKLGINKIDRLILTHLDLDHFGGIETVLNLIPVYQIYTHGIPSKKQMMIQNIGNQYNISIDSLNWGDRIQLGQSSYIDVLSPLPARINGINTENNRSLALKITHKNNQFLLTGDMDNTEESVLARFYQDEINADLLKLGHHGSRYSSSNTLLFYTQAKIAVNSCAAQNRYHHPHPSIIQKINSLDLYSYFGKKFN